MPRQVDIAAKRMITFLQKRTQNGQYYEVLRVCLPLVVSLSATMIMEFTDRIFLANYEINAIAAALPAGITSYLFIAFFAGVGGYVGVFIAQYTGRGLHNKIGAVLWQGIYFTLVAGVVLWLLAVFATEAIFSIAGHAPEVQVLEGIYFSILCKGAILHVAMATLASFFTGRGLTRPVMTITFIGIFVNFPLDYALIFGHWGLPEMGIKGAAIATVTSWGINVIFFVGLIFTKENDQRFGVLSCFKFDKKVFTRLMRFGIPGSLQFTIDILAFTTFVLLVGRIGKEELAATNIVFSINALAFMPAMGVSQGMTILMGQALGKRNPPLASAYVRSGCFLLIGYTLVIDLIFIFAPDLVLSPFMVSEPGTYSYEEILEYSKVLLNIVTIYLFFDALYMVFSGALRGAGDTRYMMFGTFCISIICLMLPMYIGIEYFHISVRTAWMWMLFFITALSFLSGLRYQRGSWKNMLVIDDKSE